MNRPQGNRFYRTKFMTNVVRRVDATNGETYEYYEYED